MTRFLARYLWAALWALLYTVLLWGAGSIFGWASYEHHHVFDVLTLVFVVALVSHVSGQRDGERNR